MSLRAIVHKYVSQYRPRLQAELDWYARRPSLEAAIENAALAKMSDASKHPHQKRRTEATLESSRRALLANSVEIAQSRSFHELFSLIDAILTPIHGAGRLYKYDTALWIGAKLGLFPERVYPHAGTREGAGALGLNRNAEALEVIIFPPEFRQLEPHEIEDLLCIFKDRLKASE